MRLPDGFIEELRNRCDIEQTIAPYVALKRRGKNLVGLCPFHGEKTPSFTLYPENGSFYCFGCGAGGDVITFIRKIEHLDYLDAVKLLCDRAGMKMPDNTQDDAASRLRVRVLDANRAAARLFHKILLSPQGREGLTYYHSRGYTDETIRHFGLGYAPDGFHTVLDALRAQGFHDEELVAAFLCKRSSGGRLYDVFRHRVMIPIIDLRGNVVAFGGRVLDDQKPKYLNSADTPAFKKSQTLFALNFAKNSGEPSLILCEGYMDVIALHQAGFRNAVAALGTSFTEEHARLLSRYIGPGGEVMLIFDADGAGQKATSRAIGILRKTGVTIRVITIPDGKDPDEYIRKKGSESFRLLLRGATSDVEYRLNEMKRQHILTTPDGQVAFLRQAVGLLAQLSSPIERDVYAGKLSQELSISKGAILSQMDILLKKRTKQETKTQMTRIVQQQDAVQGKINPEAARYPRAAAAEEGLLGLLLRNPDYIPAACDGLPPEQMVTAFNRQLYGTLIDRQREGHMTELTFLSADFTEDEMGYITRLMQTASERVNSLDEVRHYIDILHSERQRLVLDHPETLTPEQIRQQLEILRKEKK